MKEKLRTEDKNFINDGCKIDFLNGECFDIVIADYLLGAIDGFAPYFQVNYLEDLKRHIKDKMYIIGLEPYPDVTDSKGGQLILELSRLRDACILLAKHRPYREYPLMWVTQNLQSHSLQLRNNKISYLLWSSVCT